EADCDAVAGRVLRHVRLGFGPRDHDRNSRHPLRGVDGDLIKRVSVTFAMRKIEAHRKSLVRAYKVHFLDYTVGQTAAVTRKVRVLADADIFRTEDQLD